MLWVFDLQKQIWFLLTKDASDTRFAIFLESFPPRPVERIHTTFNTFHYTRYYIVYHILRSLKPNLRSWEKSFFFTWKYYRVKKSYFWNCIHFKMYYFTLERNSSKSCFFFSCIALLFLSLACVTRAFVFRLYTPACEE